MSQTIAILGRQPELGLAELESLFGAEKLTPFSTSAVIDVKPADFPMARLGGTMKAAKILAYLPFTEWEKIDSYLSKTLPEHLPAIPDGKIRLGLSTHGLKVNPRRQNATGLQLKKIVKRAGRSVRVVPNVTNELNTAQVLHNQLTGPTGLELVMVSDGRQTILAQAFAVQDIEAYAARDQARPKRDARVGMLPPKLAQTIVNLARPEKTSTILDPFCGTGVILQEAMMMGLSAYGTDLEPRMIKYSEVNLEWLAQNMQLSPESYQLSQGDATNYKWADSNVGHIPSDFRIACETYLGQPFSSEPRPEKLKQVMQDVDTIHRKFLQNVAKQTKEGFRMCIAVPAWKTKNGFKHLRTLENLAELGYTRESFVHTGNENLIYHRPDQIVARELVVLTRK